MLQLRPHHINCIFFYQGLGYNREFIRRMDGILNYLKENPYNKIKLVAKCDALCFSCPNNIENNTCTSKEKVENLDYDILKEYQLKENKIYTFRYILDNIYSNFDVMKFHRICNACNWYKTGVCREDIIESQRVKWFHDFT